MCQIKITKFDKNCYYIHSKSAQKVFLLSDEETLLMLVMVGII